MMLVRVARLRIDSVSEVMRACIVMFKLVATRLSGTCGGMTRITAVDWYVSGHRYAITTASTIPANVVPTIHPL